MSGRERGAGGFSGVRIGEICGSISTLLPPADGKKNAFDPQIAQIFTD
jgi:hypothetical protein